MTPEVNEPSPREFLSALARNWVSVVGGSLAVPFTFASVFSDAKYTKLLFGLLAVAGGWPRLCGWPIFAESKGGAFELRACLVL